jgi:hypothetical protein
VRRDDGTEVAVADPGGTLHRWLGPASGVRIRPDRIVAAVVPVRGRRATGGRRKR